MKNQKTILIADDDIDYLYQIKLKVEQLGFNVITAESQAEAEKILQNIKPDLAIFDLMMETEDSGFILTYKFKKQYPDIPVIILTAVTAETGISFGNEISNENKWIKADVFLDKSLQTEKLQREINKLLKI